MYELIYLGTLLGNCLGKRGSNETIRERRCSSNQPRQQRADSPLCRAGRSAGKTTPSEKQPERGQSAKTTRTVRQLTDLNSQQSSQTINLKHTKEHGADSPVSDGGRSASHRSTEGQQRTKFFLQKKQTPGADCPPLTVRTVRRSPESAEQKQIVRADGPPGETGRSAVSRQKTDKF
jgi:hypothetical protein